MPSEQSNFQSEGECVQISSGRTERVLFTRKSVLLRNGGDKHTYNKVNGGNDIDDSVPDGWAKMGSGLMLILRDINTQEMRLLFLDEEPLKRNITRLADRVRLNAIVNAEKQEIKTSARLSAVIFKAIDISDIPGGKCYGYVTDFDTSDSAKTFKSLLTNGGKTSTVKKSLVSSQGDKAGIFGSKSGASSNGATGAKSVSAAAGFGGFGASAESEQKVDNEKSAGLFGGGAGTTGSEKKGVSSFGGNGGFSFGGAGDIGGNKKTTAVAGSPEPVKKDGASSTPMFGTPSGGFGKPESPGKADASKDKGGFSFGQGAAVEDTNDVAKSNMFGSASTKLGVESKKGEGQENKSSALSFGKTAADSDSKKKKKLSFGASSTSKDDKPLFGNTNGFSFGGAGKTEDKEDAKETNTTDSGDQQGGFGSTGGFSFGNSANPEDKQPKSGTDEKKGSSFGGGFGTDSGANKSKAQEKSSEVSKESMGFGSFGGFGGNNSNESKNESGSTTTSSVGFGGGFGASNKSEKKKTDDGTASLSAGFGSGFGFGNGSNASSEEKVDAKPAFGSGFGFGGAASNENPTAKINYKDEVTKIYQQYNPSKLGSVDAVLKKYAGHEDKLLEKLRKKYVKASGTAKAPLASPNPVPNAFATKPLDAPSSFSFGAGANTKSTSGFASSTFGSTSGTTSGFGGSSSPNNKSSSFAAGFGGEGTSGGSGTSAFGSSTAATKAPGAVDMGGFGSSLSGGSDAKSNGFSFGAGAGFGATSAPKPVDMGGFGSGGFGGSKSGGFGSVDSTGGFGALGGGSGGGFGGFGGGDKQGGNASSTFSSPSFTQMRG